MATPQPPIRIGAFDNVPQPDSVVRSDWPQALTPRVVHPFVDTTDRSTNWPTPPDGALSTISTSGVIEVYRAGAWRVLGDASVPHFTSTAERDAAIPSPFTGQLCTVNANLFMYEASAGGWVRTVAVTSSTVDLGAATTLGSRFQTPVTAPQITATGKVQGTTVEATINFIAGDPNAAAGFTALPDGRVTAKSGQTDLLTLTRAESSAGGAVTGTRLAAFRSSTTLLGSITAASGSTVAYNTSSDYRLKNELGPIKDALAMIVDLRPVRFAWKVDASESIGFIAHEVAEVVPTAVTGEKDALDENGDIDPQQLDHSKLVPVLVAAVQELSARVDELTARIEAV